MNPPLAQERRGVGYGIAAYGMWGLFPLFFTLLAFASPVEIVVHRVLWSLVVCAGLLLAGQITGRGGADLRALRSPRTTALLALAAFLLSLNWGIYVYAVVSRQVAQASLGYFINPLVTVLLGVLVLRERLRPAQWVAVGIGGVAVAVLTVDYGTLPWIAVSLAGSFGLYGLFKKTLGVSLGALAGLTGETLSLAPVAAGLLVWLELTDRGHFSGNPPWQALLLVASGVVTVIPLLLFAAAARRVPLSTVGLLQYLTPVLQLLCAVVVLGEHMPPSRWIGFALVWTALAVLTADSLTASRGRARATEPGPQVDPEAPRTSARS